MHQPDDIVQATNDTSPPPPFSPEHWEAIVGELGLSPQLTRVVEQVFRGKSNEQIAKALGLREGTVKDYLRRVCTQTGTNNRVQLVIHVTIVSYQLLGHNPYQLE